MMCEENVVFSPEGDIGFPEEEEALNDTDEAWKNAICDDREEVLRTFLGKLKQLARESLGRQYSPKEIEALEGALDRAVEILDPYSSG